jgi:hypothetical protein
LGIVDDRAQGSIVPLQQRSGRVNSDRFGHGTDLQREVQPHALLNLHFEPVALRRLESYVFGLESISPRRNLSERIVAGAGGFRGSHCVGGHFGECHFRLGQAGPSRIRKVASDGPSSLPKNARDAYQT